MRLATVINPATNSPTPVLELAAATGATPSRVPIGPLFATDSILSVLPHLDRLAATLRENPHPPGDPALAAARYLPPIPQPPSFRDFYAFEQHVKTCRARRNLEVPPAWYERPAFYFSNPGALVGHDAPVHAPADSLMLDFELELAAIIARPGRDIAAADAWSHIAGFTILNDFSARDLQVPEMSVGLGPAKAKDFATAVGPFLLTLDELRDRIDSENRLHLQMRARLNGREITNANAASMHFTWPRIIEHASRDAQLFTGDLIASGTVGGGCILELGPETTGGYLKPGDVVELEIERLGILRTPIVARPDPRTRIESSNPRRSLCPST